jgi:predicted phage tail protein
MSERSLRSNVSNDGRSTLDDDDMEAVRVLMERAASLRSTTRSLAETLRTATVQRDDLDSQLHEHVQDASAQCAELTERLRVSCSESEVLAEMLRAMTVERNALAAAATTTPPPHAPQCVDELAKEHEQCGAATAQAEHSLRALALRLRLAHTESDALSRLLRATTTERDSLANALRVACVQLDALEAQLAEHEQLVQRVARLTAQRDVLRVRALTAEHLHEQAKRASSTAACAASEGE